MIEANDDVVVLFAVIPKDDLKKCDLPKTGFYKAWEVGELKTLVDVRTCKGWGAMIAAALNRLSRKLCPEISESPIIKL